MGILAFTNPGTFSAVAINSIFPLASAEWGCCYTIIDPPLQRTLIMQISTPPLQRTLIMQSIDALFDQFIVTNDPAAV